MSTDPRPHPSQRPADAGPSRTGLPDAGHLDEDAEALEDPVHAGDARHQHELHEHATEDAEAATDSLPTEGG